MMKESKKDLVEQIKRMSIELDKSNKQSIYLRSRLDHIHKSIWLVRIMLIIMVIISGYLYNRFDSRFNDGYDIGISENITGTKTAVCIVKDK